MLNRSPPQLLAEIILVDDGSDAAHLGKDLDDYVAALPKVRLIRQGSRTGLVQASCFFSFFLAFAFAFAFAVAFAAHGHRHRRRRPRRPRRRER